MAESLPESDHKKMKDVPLVQDQGFFQHSTGDMYNGAFEARKKDRSARMHGYGVYSTAEGDHYTGTWENDRLGANEEVSITYLNGSKYEGQFSNWCYSGRGQYTYPDGSVISGNFVENCPVDQLVLTDPNGHQWTGKAENGFAWFQPVNHFYDFLDRTAGSKVKRGKTKNSKTSNIIQAPLAKE